MNPPPPDFEATFTPELDELLLEAVRSTYDVAIECFGQAKPYSDGHTFGTDLYRFAGHKLTETSDTHPDLISMVQEHPSFIHQVGRFKVICHRVAKERDADIWASFPNPDTEGVHRGATYFLPGFEPDLSKADTLVLAHIGNQDDGLCGLFLCVPIVRDDRSIEWGYVHKLYMRPVEQGSSNPSSPSEEPVDVAAATIRRRAQKKSEQ